MDLSLFKWLNEQPKLPRRWEIGLAWIFAILTVAVVGSPFWAMMAIAWMDR